VDVKQAVQDLLDDLELIPEKYREWCQQYHVAHHKRYPILLSFLEPSDKTGKIADIGCFPGQVTVFLKVLGYDVVGFDLDPERMKDVWTKHNIQVRKADVERDPLPAKDNSFDVVLFTEILEHLRLNPFFALREAKRILKPGGRIIISTPNVTLYLRLLFLLGIDIQGNPVEEFATLEEVGHMGHIRLYSTREVKGFLEHAGFKVIRHSYRGHPLGGKKAYAASLLCPTGKNRLGYLYMIGRKEAETLSGTERSS